MSGKLQGKKAFVSGGSRGIGAAIAMRLSADGADVVFTYAGNAEKAQETVDNITADGRLAKAIKADAANQLAVKAAVEEASVFLNGIDILVHNAGVADYAPLPDFSDENFNRHFSINVGAVFTGTKTALLYMRDGGRVIIIGSVNAHTMPFPGISVYGATKAAVAVMAKGWARDLGARGILVNVIQPGPINTEMNPADNRDIAVTMSRMTALGRYGEAGEIASVAAFLASDDASFITGATIDVDGGFSI
jgi:3-oxoacyl-[acyl-carrier protein] reductase